MFWFLMDPLYLLVTLIGLAFPLIAQARVEGLTILTADKRFAAYDVALA